MLAWCSLGPAALSGMNGAREQLELARTVADNRARTLQVVQARRRSPQAIIAAPNASNIPSGH